MGSFNIGGGGTKTNTIPYTTTALEDLKKGDNVIFNEDGVYKSKQSNFLFNSEQAITTEIYNSNNQNQMLWLSDTRLLGWYSSGNKIFLYDWNGSVLTLLDTFSSIISVTDGWYQMVRIDDTHVLLMSRSSAYRPYISIVDFSNDTVNVLYSAQLDASDATIGQNHLVHMVDDYFVACTYVSGDYDIWAWRILINRDTWTVDLVTNIALYTTSSNSNQKVVRVQEVDGEVYIAYNTTSTVLNFHRITTTTIDYKGVATGTSQYNIGFFFKFGGVVYYRTTSTICNLSTMVGANENDLGLPSSTDYGGSFPKDNYENVQYAIRSNNMVKHAGELVSVDPIEKFSNSGYPGFRISTIFHGGPDKYWTASGTYAFEFNSFAIGNRYASLVDYANGKIRIYDKIKISQGIVATDVTAGNDVEILVAA